MTQPNHPAGESISGLLHEAADQHVLTSEEVLRRFNMLEVRMGVVEDIAVELQVAVKDNTTITTTIAEGTAEILGIFKSAKGGVQVLGWLGTFAKWAAGIVGLFVAIYAFVQNVRGQR